MFIIDIFALAGHLDIWTWFYWWSPYVAYPLIYNLQLSKQRNFIKNTFVTCKLPAAAKWGRELWKNKYLLLASYIRNVWNWNWEWKDHGTIVKSYLSYLANLGLQYPCENNLFVSNLLPSISSCSGVLPERTNCKTHLP